MNKEEWHKVKIRFKKTDWVSTSRFDDEYMYFIEINVKTNEERVLRKVKLEKLKQ